MNTNIIDQIIDSENNPVTVRQLLVQLAETRDTSLDTECSDAVKVNLAERDILDDVCARIIDAKARGWCINSLIDDFFTDLDYINSVA